MKKEKIKVICFLFFSIFSNLSYSLNETCENLDSVETPSDECIKHYETVLEKNKNVSKDTLAIYEIILSSYYYKNKQIEKLDYLCKKNPYYIDFRSYCFKLLMSIGDDFYQNRSLKQAFNTYEIASNYDSSGISEFKIAEMYQRGEGVNYIQLDAAIHQYKMALQKITDTKLKAYAINDMGVAYDSLMDHVSAFQCYKASAEMGFTLAQLNLAKSYANGTGVITDNSQAYAWSSVAIAKGLENNEQELEAKNIKNSQALILSIYDKTGQALKDADNLAKLYYKTYVLGEKIEVKKSSFEDKIYSAIKDILN